ncbi:MAG: Gfo/Idh/MocA family oxidoreductase [Planctomycetes bacterium]|nr:Gfo/Idh/MocA family oxidoreductase [Planctomycetota bacterium]
MANKNSLKVTRRNFLAASASAFAIPYIITSDTLGKGGKPAASQRITVAHIGIGGQGTLVMNGFLGLKDSQSIAVCDCFEDRRQGGAKIVDDKYTTTGCRQYSDFRDVLASDDIDAVVIATPDHWHVPIAIAAAKAGKDMYVEKPLGMSIEENKALRIVLAMYGNVFQYGTMQRSFSSHCAFACDIVRNGYIGELKEVHITAPTGGSGGSTVPVDVPEGLDYEMWLGPAPFSPFTKDRCTPGGSYFCYDNSLGFISGWGAHPLDIMHWGYPYIPVEYEGTGVIPKKGLYDTITNWNIRGKFESGVKFFFMDGPDMTTFIGNEGTISVSRQQITANPKSLLRTVIKPDEIHHLKSRNHYADFIGCVKTRSAPSSPIDSAVQSDFISHLSDITIRTGRRIKWDPQNETIIGDETATRMMKRPMSNPWHL